MGTHIQGRFVPLEACFNFRDIGGYAGLHNRMVRWGRLFRSMTPQYMSKADVAHLRDLRVNLVIDLRGSDAPRSGPIVDLPASRIAVSPAFVKSGVVSPEAASFMAAPPVEALPRLLELYGTSFAEAVTAMSVVPNAVTLFHCRLGKDRTGVFAALVLKLLGVRNTDIIEDYMLTAYFEPETRKLLSSVEETAESREPRVAREPVSRAAMIALLNRLESQYGTAFNYFLHHGASAVHLSALIEDLLEPLTRRSQTSAELSWSG
jgi:hypothetical protein